MSINQIRFSRPYRRATAGAAVVVTLGGLLAACGSSGTTASTTTTAATGAATTQTTTTRPQGMPGFGQPVTGAAATKARAAALKKYPGTVEQVMKLQDGSYVVHVLRTSGGEVHVKVSKAFAVTGLEQGPPGGGAPPSSGAAPGASTTRS
jgi:hypothetical protein